MQQDKDIRSADPYLTWQDLLEAESEGYAALGAAEESMAQPQASAAADDPWQGTAKVRLPPDVEALLAEKERLEDELKRLAGLGEPRPEDERLKRMYPVKVHTKESRIEERRLRQHDEHQRMLKQRVLEAKLARAREQEHQAELEAERRRKAIERALAKVRAQLRQAELEAERRRKAIARVQAAVREQQRQAESEADRQRKEIEKALVQARWASDRQKALIKRAQERRRETLWQEQCLSNQRERAIHLARERKEQQRDDLQKEQVQQAWIMERFRQGIQQERVQEAKREARLEKQLEALVDSVDARERKSDSSRLDVLQRFYQRKKQALDWEQDRERLRQRALQRRHEDQTLSDRLNRRSTNANQFLALHKKSPGNTLCRTITTR